MKVYLDASCIVPLFVTEGASDAIDGLIQSMAGPAWISDYGAGEYASAIARRVRMRSVQPVRASALLAEFDRWCAGFARSIAIATDDLATAIALVRRFELKLRLPDAIHLALCQRRSLVLATLDDGLADAARALGVAHVVPV